MNVEFDDLAEAELLHDVVLHAEYGRGRRGPVEQLVDAVGRPAAELELDVIARDEWLERLDRRVVAARLEADVDVDASQILRLPDR